VAGPENEPDRQHDRNHGSVLAHRYTLNKQRLSCYDSGAASTYQLIFRCEHLPVSRRRDDGVRKGISGISRSRLTFRAIPHGINQSWFYIHAGTEHILRNNHLFRFTLKLGL
jgi:hypothetical protein